MNKFEIIAGLIIFIIGFVVLNIRLSAGISMIMFGEYHFVKGLYDKED